MLNKLVRFRFCVQQQPQSIVLTRDGYQVNVGLVVERKPIFLQADDIEMRVRRMNYQIGKKYGLLPIVPKELFEFQHRAPNQIAAGVDETPTHMQFNEETQERIYYHANSKYFQNVDINIKDPQTIQYLGCYYVYLLQQQDGEWSVPSMPMRENQTLEDARQGLFNRLSQDQWKIVWKSQIPFACHRNEFPNNDDMRVKGTKTFYFVGQHLEGDPNSESMHWVPRGYMNKYLSRKMYGDLISMFTA